MTSDTIWIVNQYAGSKYHGMEYRHYYLARELSKKGWKTCLITGSYSHLYTHPPTVKTNFKTETLDGVTYIWTRVPKYRDPHGLGRAINMLYFPIQLLHLTVTDLPRPRAIVVSSPSPFPIANGYIWSRRFHARLIFEVRDIWPLTLVELGSISRRHPFVAFMQLFEDFAYKHADKVVSVLPNAREYMVSRGLDPEKYYYIPNGVLPVDTTAEPDLPRHLISEVRFRPFIVGYLGTFSKSNALDVLLVAAERLRKTREIGFAIVGYGGEKPNLVEFVRTRSLDNVRLIPPVPSEHVPKVLKLFDVCYKGSRRIPLYRFGISSYKLFEYMSAGRPIIHAYSGACDPVAEANCGISVQAEDPGAISEAIMRLYNMPDDQRAQMGINGKKYVDKHHSYPSLAERFLEVIDS